MAWTGCWWEWLCATIDSTGSQNIAVGSDVAKMSPTTSDLTYAKSSSNVSSATGNKNPVAAGSRRVKPDSRFGHATFFCNCGKVTQLRKVAHIDRSLPQERRSQRFHHCHDSIRQYGCTFPAGDAGCGSRQARCAVLLFLRGA